jgi:predicted acylesterase/phospholipase RssA
MAPNALLCKSADGSIVPFEVDGVDFIDGSVQADVPFKRMATLFSVSTFIVSQVNIHVLPFIEYKLHDALPRSWSLSSPLSALYSYLCRVPRLLQRLDSP